MRETKKTATTVKKSGSMPRYQKLPRHPLQTTVVGSYPFPGWLEFASAHLEQFGEADIEELRMDAVIAAVHDQLAAGLDVITDGEQTRYDFNLAFYGRLEGIAGRPASARHFGPPPADCIPRTALERWRSSSFCRKSRPQVRS